MILRNQLLYIFLILSHYSNWQNFEKIIVKAKISCENSEISVFEHFIDVNKMVQIGSGAYRKQIDYKLTRFILYSFIILKRCLKYIVIYNNILI